jgi:predicted acetylornithine/succinylornithine family transaminase
VNTREIIEMSSAHLMRNYGRLPLALARGAGSYVWDAEGKKYLDFVGGIAVNSLGHCHPKVVEAIRSAADQMLHCSNLYHIEPQARLAAFLTQKSGLDKAFFCNSGAEANEAAIKLARRYVKLFVDADRFEVITVENSFHGRTMAALTATGQSKYHQGFEPLVPGFRYVPLNDLSALRQAVGPTTAAIMLEPIQGEGGVRPVTAEFIRLARQLCDEMGIPLIFDEVQTGLGRTGKWFGFQHYGVRPDILTLAKALGGGLPIGCTLANDRVAQGFEPGTHASTFGGGPFITRVALAAMQAIEDEQLVPAAAAAGEYLQDALRQLAERYPNLIADVRGVGCLIGIELQVPAASFVEEAMKRGLLLVSAGPQVVRLLPPLNVTTEQMDEALSIIESVMGSMSDTETKAE